VCLKLEEGVSRIINKKNIRERIENLLWQRSISLSQCSLAEYDDTMQGGMEMICRIYFIFFGEMMANEWELV
jgi:hypothetical protein